MQRVQLNLERQLPELRDLEKKKVFTKAEISAIVKKRTALETQLIRKGSNAKDWLEYIDYEKRMEKLRKIRCSKLKLKGRPTVSDYSISRHILQLYSSAVTRNPASSVLWRSYISHVLTTSNSSAEISRVLARAISLNPTSSEYWLAAIRFEADGTRASVEESLSGDDDAEAGDSPQSAGVGGGNIDAARKLVLRALRFMQSRSSGADAERIWMEWVRIEISLVERMRKRWEILGIADANTGGQKESNMELDQVDAELAEVAAETDGGSAETEAIETPDNVAEAKASGQQAVLSGIIVKAVIDNALSSSPDRLSLFSSLLEVIRPLPTILRPDLLAHIYSILQTNLPAFEASETRGQALALLSRRFVDDLAQLQKDKLSLKPVPIDSLEWVEAVGESTKAFRSAIAGQDSENMILLEQAAEFIGQMLDSTEDASLKQYLQAHLSHIARQAANLKSL